MNIKTDIAQYLHNQGIGTLGTNLFASYMPDIEANSLTICVIDTGGIEPDTYLPTDRPTFQVFVRANDYETGRAKLDQIFDLLHKETNSTLVSGGTYFYNIFANSRGGHIGRNPADKDEFSINFRCFVRLDE